MGLREAAKTKRHIFVPVAYDRSILREPDAGTVDIAALCSGECGSLVGIGTLRFLKSILKAPIARAVEQICAPLYFFARRSHGCSQMAQLARSRGMTEAEALKFAAAYSGHSMQVGIAVEAINRGVAHEHVADHLGHASTEMTRRYARKAAKGRALVSGVGV